MFTALRRRGAGFILLSLQNGLTLIRRGAVFILLSLQNGFTLIRRYGLYGSVCRTAFTCKGNCFRTAQFKEPRFTLIKRGTVFIPLRLKNQGSQRTGTVVNTRGIQQQINNFN